MLPEQWQAADAGVCLGCQRRIVRTLNATTGELVDLDPYAVDAADELRAWAAGRQSFLLALGPGSTLRAQHRSDAEIARKPAGFIRDRVVLSHQCRTGPT